MKKRMFFPLAIVFVVVSALLYAPQNHALPYRVVRPHAKLLKRSILAFEQNVAACTLTKPLPGQLTLIGWFAGQDMPPPPKCDGSYSKALEPCTYNHNCTVYYCAQGSKATLCSPKGGTYPCVGCEDAKDVRCTP
jgi:hypothetical protein